MSDIEQAAMDIPDFGAFDYDAIPAEDRDFLRQKEVCIKARTAQTVIENGRDLLEAKARVGHGNFLKWVEGSFPWNYKTAQRMMQVAENLKLDTGVQYENFQIKALYALAGPSVPESAREEAIQKAESGEKVTHSDARKLIEAHKQIKVERERVETLESRIEELEAQLPTEDVNKEILRLKKELDAANSKPPVVEPPKDYKETKDEAARLREELKRNEGIRASLEKEKEKAIKEGVEKKLSEVDKELKRKRKEIGGIEARIKALKDDRALWEKRANNSEWIETNRKEIESCLLKISVAMRDIFEDCEITDEARPGLTRLQRDMAQGAKFFENLLGGGFIGE